MQLSKNKINKVRNNFEKTRGNIMYNLNRGYSGYSMSNRAVEAYTYGEMPLSKWTKKAIINRISYFVNDLEENVDIAKLNKCKTDVLKEYFLFNSSWHHTGTFFNETKFYDVDSDKVETLTEDIISNLLLKSKINKQKKTERRIKYYKVEFLDWYQKGKCRQIIDFGEVSGNWFYSTDGKKKQINANGFKLIEEISKRSVTINRKKAIEFKKLYRYQAKYKNIDNFLYRALNDDLEKSFIQDLKTLRQKCINIKKENLRYGWEMTNPKLLERLDDEDYIEDRISDDFIKKVRSNRNI